MSKQNIMSQIYGYSICLVSLLVIVFTLPFFIGSIIDTSNKNFAADLDTKYLTFDNYKSDYLEHKQFSSDTNKQTPPDSVVLQKYNEEKILMLDQKSFDTRKSIITQTIWMIICAILFFLHWKWVRKFVVKPESPCGSDKEVR
jgi:hypothetical protein